MKLLNKYCIPVTVIWAGLLFVGSVLPATSKLSAEIEKFNFGGFGMHIIGYAVFAFFLIITIKNHSSKNPYLYSVLVAVAYGLIMEGLQAFVPTRDPSVVDALANISGAFITVTIHRFRNGIKRIFEK